MSSKMPRASGAKTVSAPKRWARAAWALAAAVLVLVVVLAAGRGPQIVTLRAPHASFSMTVADTDTARQKGLSGRTGLPSDQGMLFVYGRPGKQCFWMKDMHFALDVVWIAADKRVITVRAGVTPATYPSIFCVPNAQYVIELNAGQAAPAGISPGQALRW